MINKLSSLDGCREFIEDMCRDPGYADPVLSTPERIAERLEGAFGKPDGHVLGVFSGGELTGLFRFLILDEERYIEMIAGLSRESDAYSEIAGYLQENYPGYQADFVFNPENRPLREMLLGKGASFFPEQQKMVLSGQPGPVDTDGIELLSETYLDQYLAMHDTDTYWTGEKVAAAPERFDVLLAVDGGAVVGYLDLTNCYDENEPVDVMVREGYRRRGWGRKLLAKAIERNRPAGMRLLVDVDNAPAIALYTSMGFVKLQGHNSQTATWHIR